MRAHIYWSVNKITFGEDDPHQGTPSEGFHVVLKVGDTKLQVPIRQYNLNTVTLLENIVEKINDK